MPKASKPSTMPTAGRRHLLAGISVAALGAIGHAAPGHVQADAAVLFAAAEYLALQGRASLALAFASARHGRSC